jgi:hypothetical protein
MTVNGTLQHKLPSTYEELDPGIDGFEPLFLSGTYEAADRT